MGAKIHLLYNGELLCGGKYADAVTTDRYEEVTCGHCRRSIREIGFDRFKFAEPGTHYDYHGEPLCDFQREAPKLVKDRKAVTCARCKWIIQGRRRLNGQEELDQERLF